MTIDTASAPFRLAVAASFTAEPLRNVISFWGSQLNANFDVAFAPYNQIAQTLLDPHSVIGSNAHGINIVLARLEDLGSVKDLGRVEENSRELSEHLREAAQRLRAPLLFCLCPSASSFPPRVETTLAASLEDTPGLQFLSSAQIERLYPVSEPHDPEGDRLGKIPYTELYYTALGTALVRHAHALFRPPLKVVALDCDNTLWNGICGEDGSEGVSLDAPRRALQEFMVEQRECGVLLSMASKNNEQDVLETFAAHPEMPLALRHFASWRLNWQSKSENLVSLSEELGLGLDSFIFVDDNPKECAELSGALPEVLTLALPADIERTPEFLNHVWAFDHPVITEEDRNRNAYYAQQHEFGAEVQRASSLDEFMAGLKLRVSIQPLDRARLPRAAQLTQRTNQFNLTTVRRSEAEIRSLDGYEVYTAEVGDRFGDYGLVGVVITKERDNELVVDTFLLSCRVLGRGVEHRVAAFLGEKAMASGLSHVIFPYERTKKNAPAATFLDSIDFAERRESRGGFVVKAPASKLVDFRWSSNQRAAPTTAAKPHAATHRRAVDYACIANQLATPEAILQAVRGRRAQAQTSASMTETEAQLAGIWANLLDKPHVRASDNFFDLGGHSLLAVLLLLRIRETFGVELSIDDVYSGTLTLSDLAARIETAQLGGIDPAEYAALLAEIEGMSDEEARQLLDDAAANP
ncbi:MAG TPA: HAD-IIIC family phosphatase [Bryobacteraceae bacterium]|nr:HAD-IIIC family phosphatase [Bryobacteraceae bacterium]